MTQDLNLTMAIAELEEALLTQLPNMPQMLARIHTNLAKDPQLIASLTDDQISTITKGLSTYTKAEIITTKPKKASLKNVSLSDLL